MQLFKKLIRNFEPIFIVTMLLLLIYVWLFCMELTWFGKLFLLPLTVIGSLCVMAIIFNWFDELTVWANKNKDEEG